VQRVLVIGTSGSGKSYVARAIAERLGLTYIENDAIIWRPNWQPTPRADRVIEYDRATAGDRWVIDGNLAGTDDEDRLVMARCDTIVWLDLPRREVWVAITRRTLRRAWTREPLFHGNVERWAQVFSKDSMILWSIQTFGRRRRAYTALFERIDKMRIRLRSRAQVDRWLATLTPR
jgi:adenylate kinase family enzyme